MSYKNEPSLWSPAAPSTAPPSTSKKSTFSTYYVAAPPTTSNSTATSGLGGISDEEINRKLVHRSARIGYLEAEYMNLERLKNAERKAAAFEIQFANLQQQNSSRHLMNAPAANALVLRDYDVAETIEKFERKVARLNRRVARRDAIISELRDQLDGRQQESGRILNNNKPDDIILLSTESPSSQNYHSPRTSTIYKSNLDSRKRPYAGQDE